MSIVIIPVKYAESSKQQSKVGEKTTVAGEVVISRLNGVSQTPTLMMGLICCLLQNDLTGYGTRVGGEDDLE